LKRCLWILLSLCVLMSALPLGAFAETGDFQYTTQNGKAIITKYIGKETEVVIPSELGGCPVTAIGEKAFAGCTSITEVVIPEGVTVIGYRAFYGCFSLIDVEMPETLTAIERNAFQDCYQLSSVWFPEALTSIGEFAFSFCVSLTWVEIPCNVEQMGRGVFGNCQSLTEIYCYFNDIPSTWNYYWAENCDATVYVIDDGKEDPVNALQYSVKDGKATVIGIENAVGDLVIPAEYEGVPVTAIGDFAFLRCKELTSVVISDGIECIGEGAFDECSSMRSVTIPSSVKVIGDSAFSHCGLEQVILPEGVQHIGGWAFSECPRLAYASIPSSVTEMGDYVFILSDNLRKIDCAANKQPDSWDENWLTGAYPIVEWGKEPPAEQVVYGDVNGDGVVDGKDSTHLLRYLAEYDHATGECAIEISHGADCNGDSEVNGKDLTRLLRYLANYNHETGTSTIVLGK